MTWASLDDLVQPNLVYINPLMAGLAHGFILNPSIIANLLEMGVVIMEIGIPWPTLTRYQDSGH